MQKHVVSGALPPQQCHRWWSAATRPTARHPSWAARPWAGRPLEAAHLPSPLGRPPPHRHLKALVTSVFPLQQHHGQPECLTRKPVCRQSAGVPPVSASAAGRYVFLWWTGTPVEVRRSVGRRVYSPLSSAPREAMRDPTQPKRGTATMIHQLKRLRVPRAARGVAFSDRTGSCLPRLGPSPAVVPRSGAAIRHPFVPLLIDEAQ